LLGLIALDTVMEVEAMGRAKLLLSWWPEGERERERERERENSNQDPPFNTATTWGPSLPHMGIWGHFSSKLQQESQAPHPFAPALSIAPEAGV
jgi:hypothetical protein